VSGVDEGAPRVAALAHLLLQTSDLEAAERFYLGTLGFGLRKRERFRDGRPLTLTHQGMGITDGRADGPGANVDHIAFHVEGLDALVERARRDGVRVIRGPEVNGYGTSVYLADPDGNEIELIEPPAEATA
jgi:ureidoacrylate peracid hydrolase